MTISTPPPAGVEYKIAPTMLAPRPSRPVSSRAALSGVTEVDGAGELVALVAVTGIEDDVNDVIEPGAFRRSRESARCAAFSVMIGTARWPRPSRWPS